MTKTILVMLLCTNLLLGVVLITQNRPGVLGSLFFEQELRTALNRVLPEKIFDSVWNNLVSFSTYFESADGYSISNTNGTSTVGVNGLLMQTGATSGNSTLFRKTSNNLSATTSRIYSFRKPQRFRTDFEVNSTSNVIFAVARGGDVNSTTEIYYGFRLSSSTLSGVSRNGGTESSVTISTSTRPNTVYLVEARYFPNGKIIYLLRNNITNIMDVVGVITTNIPSSTASISSSTKPLFNYFLRTDSTADKQAQVSFFEYMQEAP